MINHERHERTKERKPGRHENHKNHEKDCIWFRVLRGFVANGLVLNG